MEIARIAEIRVSPTDLDESTPYALCNWIELFVGTALNEAGYIAAELPEDAADFLDLMRYYGEWCNGGHQACNGNINDVDSWRRASRLLGRMNLQDRQELLNAFIEFSIVNEDRVNDLYANDEAQAARRLFDPFDDRFWELERRDGSFDAILYHWLVARPWLVVDPAMPPFSMQAIRASIPAHPSAQDRRDKEMRRRAAENHGSNLATLQRLRDHLIGRNKT